MKWPRLPWRLRLLALALLALAAAIADPAFTVARPTPEAIVVLDISQSMDVPDQQLDGRPVSRLRYAKAALRGALAELPCGSRVGLGVFSEYRIFLLTAPAEVCAGYGDLGALIDRIDNLMAWTNASEIRKGVLNGREAALALPDHPALVFITDGQEAPPLARGQGRVFDGKPGDLAGTLVGVGGTLPQPIPKTDKLGNSLGFWNEREVVQPARTGEAGGPARGSEQLSALDEPHLVALAGEIGFGYRRLDSPDGLRAALLDPQLARPRPVPWHAGDALALLALALMTAALTLRRA